MRSISARASATVMCPSLTDSCNDENLGKLGIVIGCKSGHGGCRALHPLRDLFERVLAATESPIEGDVETRERAVVDRVDGADHALSGADALTDPEAFDEARAVFH